MQAPAGTKLPNKYSNSATCSKLPPSENSDPAVFSMRIRSFPARSSSVHRLLDGQGDSLQSFLAAASAERAWMQHQELRTESQRSLHLAAKCHDRLGMKVGVAARQIHQVVGMDDQRLQSVLLAQAIHLVALRTRQVIGLPLPRARGENLERVAAQPVGAFRRILHSTGRRGVDANPPRSQLRRLLRRDGNSFRMSFSFFSES